MRILSVLFFLLLFLPLYSQQTLNPIHSFYKDRFYEMALDKDDLYPSFFPRSAGEVGLKAYIRDSSIQYYQMTQKLYKDHLFEISGEGYSLNMSPTFNLSRGQNRADTSAQSIYQNTRGFLMELDVYDKLSFSTSFYENQARFFDYESQHYIRNGELYPKPENGEGVYSPQNAVVPGAARTKPFKEGGFDYGYAIGYLVYAPVKNVRIMAGNNHQFIGAGHRSLFYSDNSVPSTYFRTDFKFLKRFDYTAFRARSFNLMRRQVSNTVEAFYESKYFSAHYLSFKASKNLRLSLFEGSYWKTDDGFKTSNLPYRYLAPVLFFPSIYGASASSVNHSIHGFEAEGRIKNLILYGQLAAKQWHLNLMAAQVGFRWYSPFKVKEMLVQMEYNEVPRGIYENQDPRLSYSNYNMPSAHIRGSGFSEFVLRVTKTYKRAFFNFNLSHYDLKNHFLHDHLPYTGVNTEVESGKQILNVSSELGFRLNKKLNLNIFVRYDYRTSTVAGDIPLTNGVSVGLATRLINHYKDF